MTNTQKALVGTLLLSKNLEKQKEISDYLLPDFFDDELKDIVKTIKNKNKEHKLAEAINFANELQDLLILCISNASLGSDIANLFAELKKEYLENLIFKVQNNKDFKSFEEFKAKILEGEKKAEILDYTKPESIQDILQLALQDQMENPFDLEKLPKTGFVEFDKEIFKGFMPGQLVTVGGYSGVGKSTFIFSLVKNLAKKNKVLLYSLEMGRFTITARVLSKISGLPFFYCLNLANPETQKNIDRYKLRGKLNTGLSELEKYNLLIIDNENNINKMVNQIKNLAKNKEVDFILIDYVQLIKPANTKIQRHEQVGQITRELKLLAMQHNITIIILAQLGRASLNKEEPQISDLRESGSIEQDSDYVFLLYQDKDGDRNLKLGKDRLFGSYGTAKLRFDSVTKSYY